MHGVGADKGEGGGPKSQKFEQKSYVHGPWGRRARVVGQTLRQIEEEEEGYLLCDKC